MAPLDRANNRPVPPLGASPLVEHGALRDHPEDGLILGSSLHLPEFHLQGRLAYALSSRRLLYKLGWDPPPWGSFGLVAALGDDGHAFSAEAEASLRLSAWISDLAKCSGGCKLRPFYKDLYSVGGDRGP